MTSSEQPPPPTATAALDGDGDGGQHIPAIWLEKGRKLHDERNLTEEILEELRLKSTYTNREIMRLYECFSATDSRGAGVISFSTLLRFPLFRWNPYRKRIFQLLDKFRDQSYTFVKVVQMLSVFSPQAPREWKLKFAFQVYDQDEDGVLSRDDVRRTLFQAIGNLSSEEEISNVLEKVFSEVLLDDNGCITYDQWIRVLDSNEIAKNYTFEL